MIAQIKFNYKMYFIIIIMLFLNKINFKLDELKKIHRVKSRLQLI